MNSLIRCVSVSSRCTITAIVILCLLFCSGCDFSLGDINTEQIFKETEQSQTVADTQTQTEAETQPPTQPPTEALPLCYSLYMTDYNGYTVSDVVNLWGDNFVVANELYGGGWGYFYYPNSDCPFCFYFKADATTMGLTPSYDEPLTAVSISPTRHMSVDYYISEGVSVDFNKDEYLSANPDGQLMYSEMDMSYMYVYTCDSSDVTCSWYNKSTDDPASFIVVGFI